MNEVGAKFRSGRWARFFVVVPAIVLELLLSSPVYAGIPQRSLQIGDSSTGATTNYQLSFAIASPVTLGSIKLVFCSNSPLLGQPCTPPAGFDISNATLASQSGEVGFSIYALGTNANTVVLSRVPVLTSSASVNYTFNNVSNPSSSGAYFARLQTFATSDASGAENDHGGLAMALNDQVQISTTVPPYLLFCEAITISGFDCSTASGNYLNFGNLASNGTASAETEMVTATNALNGFNITVNGTTLTSGNNVINAINPLDVSRPGVPQFGLNLVANLTPSVGQNPVGPGSATPAAAYSQSNFFKFVPGDVIASTPTADDYRKLTASYIINIQNGQPIGVYVSTLTYVCLANF